jgi:hypothetical protein
MKMKKDRLLPSYDEIISKDHIDERRKDEVILNTEGSWHEIKRQRSLRRDILL